MKYIVSILTLLLSFSAQAQFGTTTGSNEKYIEVKVSDTIMVNPDAITLMISLGIKKEKSYFDDEEENEEEEERKKTNDAIQKKKQIEDVLKKNNLSFKFHEAKEEKDIFSKDFNLFENAYEVELKSETQVEKIKKDLAGIKEVSSKVTGTKLNDKEKYELLVIDKVMKKAEREASVIAKSMNVSLDKPLNVSNQSVNDVYSSMFNNPESMGGMGALFSMMGNMFKGATQQNTQVAVSKTLIVRYSIK